MNLTEKDARNIFIILDPSSRGYIEPPVLIHWATTGTIAKPPSMNEIVRERPSLSLSLLKLCGRNLKSLEECFAHIPKVSSSLLF